MHEEKGRRLGDWNRVKEDPYTRMAVLSKPYDLAIKDVVIPEPIGEQVLVKLKAAGICGSDLECSKDDPIPESSTSP